MRESCDLPGVERLAGRRDTCCVERAYVARYVLSLSRNIRFEGG